MVGSLAMVQLSRIAIELSSIFSPKLLAVWGRWLKLRDHAPLDWPVEGLTPLLESCNLNL